MRNPFFFERCPKGGPPKYTHYKYTFRWRPVIEVVIFTGPRGIKIYLFFGKMIG